MLPNYIRAKIILPLRERSNCNSKTCSCFFAENFFMDIMGPLYKLRIEYHPLLRRRKENPKGWLRHWTQHLNHSSLFVATPKALIYPEDISSFPSKLT